LLIPACARLEPRFETTRVGFPLAISPVIEQLLLLPTACSVGGRWARPGFRISSTGQSPSMASERRLVEPGDLADEPTPYPGHDGLVTAQRPQGGTRATDRSAVVLTVARPS
jgi:hypothetical protein